MEAKPVHVNRGLLLVLGIILIFVGLGAISVPLIATLAVELVIGWVLLVSGIMQAIYSFWSQAWGRFFLRLLSGLLYLAVGILLLVYPLQGVLTITLLLTILFIVEGLCKIVASIANSSMPNWGWTFFSGILALIIGGLIWGNWPSSAVWAIGLLVGINILFRGWAMIIIATAAGSRR